MLVFAPLYDYVSATTILSSKFRKKWRRAKSTVSALEVGVGMIKIVESKKDLRQCNNAKRTMI